MEGTQVRLGLISQIIKSLVRGLRLKHIEDADEGCQNMLGIYERKIYPSVDAMRDVIRLLGAQLKDSPA